MSVSTQIYVSFYPAGRWMCSKYTTGWIIFSLPVLVYPRWACVSAGKRRLALTFPSSCTAMWGGWCVEKLSEDPNTCGSFSSLFLTKQIGAICPAGRECGTQCRSSKQISSTFHFQPKYFWSGYGTPTRTTLLIPCLFSWYQHPFASEPRILISWRWEQTRNFFFFVRHLLAVWIRCQSDAHDSRKWSSCCLV